MKEAIIKSILAALVVGSPIVFGGPAKSQPADPTAGVSTTAPTNVATKVSRKDAKKKCLDETPSLKGKDLKECIKHKMSS